MTDRDLINATLQGDRVAFGQLVGRYQRMVEAAVFSGAGRRELVDDVVQDTFVTAWRTIDRLRDPEALRPWLYGIAKNLARKARRKNAREVVLDDAAPSRTPFDDVTDRERELEVAAALARLPNRYRAPLVLFYYEHCTVKEVATTLGMREQAALQRLSRGRRKLGEVLATHCEALLESKPSRAALTASVVALLPARAASAAPLVATTSLVTAVVAAAGRTWQAAAGWFVRYCRIVGGVVGSAAAVAIFVAAVGQSDAVAARQASQAAPAAQVAQASAAAQPTPQLAPPRDESGRWSPVPAKVADDPPGHVYRNISIAALDPAEACARGARGLVLGILGADTYREVGDQKYWEPSEELVEFAREAGARTAATCGGEQWPEIYAMCEGTLDELRDGNVTCYPWDPFLQP